MLTLRLATAKEFEVHNFSYDVFKACEEELGKDG